MELWRLDKILAFSGAASRREVRQLVRAGRVTADGVCPPSPEAKYDPERTDVRLDGVPVPFRRFVYLMMNKPAGVLSATEDGRCAVAADLLPEELRRRALFPAGRLDKDSEGLLLLTDDGAFCHNVISPKKKVFKRYLVRTRGVPDAADIRAVEAGLTLEDGTRCLPGYLEVLEGGEEALCAVRISEGKFHQVKRMLAALGKPVLSLRRTDIGMLHLDESLLPGKYREMTENEAFLALSDRGASALTEQIH